MSGSRLVLDAQGSPDAAWAEVASVVRGWLSTRGIALRDAVLLVPFAQLIGPARSAFAAGGGWLPRVETARTLADSLAPPVDPIPGAPTRLAAVDRLLARRLLLTMPWASSWSRRDARGFDQAVGRLVVTVHELLDALDAVPADARDAAWRELAEALPPAGRRERELAAVAVRWAALAPAARTDVLQAFRPAAWIAVEAGGGDAGVARRLAAGAAPTLTLVLDPPLEEALEVPLTLAAPALAVCESFEDEAQAAAAQVLAHLQRGERPVALISLDRLLVRRASELLARTDAVVVDETGWRLSTTRAAAGLMTLLAAARRDAGSDALLDWLKSGTRWADGWPRAVAALESRLRRAGATRVAALAAFDLDDDAAAELRAEALAALAGLRDRSRASLLDWLDATRAALRACGGEARLADDAAGRAVLASIGLDADAEERRRRWLGVGDSVLSLGEFVRWVDDVLEGEVFRPEAEARDADVHVTPLGRAMLRPFAAAVVPGADASRLGAWSAGESLLPREVAARIGAPTPESKAARERLAFAQLVRRVPATLLRRRHDAQAPLGESRYVGLLEMSLRAQGRGWRPWLDPRVDVELDAEPLPRAAATAPGLVPARLSATAVEAMRACPYRFFALHMLRLREPDELDGELDKRVFGSWLHEVLLRFHAGRVEGGDDEAALRTAATAVLRDQGLDADDFLPWQATFDAFVPRYVAFARRRDAQGARWRSGETDGTLALESIGIELYGRLDRIDEVDGGDALELIDYKAGSPSYWKQQVAFGYEDTQLAFYAALVRAATGRRVRAAYLPLEGRVLEPLSHKDVEASADALLEGVVHDVTRLREGHALHALGEGDLCRRCEARGLCRRDGWWPVAGEPGA